MSVAATLRPRDPEADAAGTLLTRLSKVARLSTQEISSVRQACAATEHLSAGVELYSEGGLLRKPALLVSGWACRFRMLSNGRRQIFGFLLPGDLLGCSCYQHRPIALTTAMTLTRSTVADAAFLREVVMERPPRYLGLATACSIAQMQQQAYLLNHVVRLGRQTAYERMAHLLLELYHRLDAVGLAGGTVIPFPPTQEVLADALGLSVVHVNRTLQQLRRDGLIEVRASSLRLLDPGQLAAVAEFRLLEISSTR